MQSLKRGALNCGKNLSIEFFLKIEKMFMFRTTSSGENLKNYKCTLLKQKKNKKTIPFTYVKYKFV